MHVLVVVHCVFRNPTLTKADMAAKMEGRIMIKISRLPTKATTNAVDGNWVTIGVIVAKLPPKDSSKVGVCNLEV